MAANTQSTTQSSGGAGVVAALVGAFLVLYGVLFFERGWNNAAAEPRYERVARGHINSHLELDALMQALRASPWATDLNRAGFVQMLAAQREGLKSLRATTRLSAARRDLRRGLSLAPSDAYAWTRLAVTEGRLNDTRAAARALAVALQIAPADRKLASLHFDLAVALWNDLSEEGRAAIERRLAQSAKWPDLANALKGNSAVVLRNRLAALKSD
jgi:hypothetical protein